MPYIHIYIDSYHHLRPQIIFAVHDYPLSLKRVSFSHLLLSLGSLGHLSIRLYTDPHIKCLQGGRSVLCLSQSPDARGFSLYFLIFFNISHLGG